MHGKTASKPFLVVNRPIPKANKKDKMLGFLYVTFVTLVFWGGFWMLVIEAVK